MLGKFFGKKEPYKEVQVKASDLGFLGEPANSEGLLVLKTELTKILTKEGNTSRAYLSKMKYQNEEKVRVALIIDGKKKATEMAKIIAQECQPLVAIDILFFESLNSDHIKNLEQNVSPFYEAKK